jgi:uncharacterized DUF497 family protein
MKIDFDPAKRLITLRERDLDMVRLGEVFEGLTYSFWDERRMYGEDRRVTIGYLDARMVVVVWTERGEVCRIISLRKANDREQAFYGPRMGRS